MGGVVAAASLALLSVACTAGSNGRRAGEPTTTIATPRQEGPAIPLLPLVEPPFVLPTAPPRSCGPFPPPTASVVSIGGGGAVRWEAALEGGGFGDTKLVVDSTAAYAPDGGLVHAIDLATGTERWRADVPGEVRELWLWGDTVIASLRSKDDDGGMVALHRADGSTAWEWKAPRGGEHSPAGGIAGVPVLVDGVGLVVGTLAGPLVVLDPGNGLPRWSVGGGERPYYAVGQGVVLREDEGSLRGLDGRSGVTRWTAGPDAHLLGVLDGAVMVASTQNLGVVPSTVRALNLADGRLRWEQQFYRDVGVRLITDAGVLVREGFAPSEWLLLDSQSGEIRWRSEVTGGLQGEPLVLGRHLVTLESPGGARTQVAARRLSDGVVDWGVVFDGIAGAMAPRVGGGVLVGGGASAHPEGQVTAVADGEVLWTARVPQRVNRAPAPLPSGGAVVQTFSGLIGCADAAASAVVPVVSG